MSATFDPRHYLADFVIEAGDQLATVDQLLARMESEVLDGRPLDAGHVQRLFRAVHTLKGMAGMLGFSAIVTLAHEVESVLDGLRDGGRLAAAELAVLVDVADALGRLLERIGATGTEDGIDVLPVQAALFKLQRGELAPAAPLDLLDRLDPHEQMAVLVDVAKGEHLLNVHFEGPEADSFQVGLAALGRVLGAWGPDGRFFEPGSTTVDVLLASERDAEQVRAEAGLPPGAVTNAPLPWATASVPAAAVTAPARPATVAPPAAPVAVRVETARLERLAALADALVVAHAHLAALAGPELAEAVEAVRGHAAAIATEVSAARRVQLATLFGRFSRPVRDLARACGKSVRLEVLGGEAFLDRDTSERLVEPLMHLIRNAIDHGIEAPAERQAAGKSAQGTIALSATLENGRLAIAVSDDGRGIDRAAVLAKAVAAGLVAPDASPEEAAIDPLIFHPGLSTAAAVTEVSGRGVGMDAVQASLEALGGVIDVSSRAGRGSRFVLRLPVSGGLAD